MPPSLSTRSAWWQLRDQVGPLVFDQRAHLVVDDVDRVEVLDLAADLFELGLRQHAPAEVRLVHGGHSSTARGVVNRHPEGRLRRGSGRNPFYTGIRRRGT